MSTIIARIFIPIRICSKLTSQINYLPRLPRVSNNIIKKFSTNVQLYNQENIHALQIKKRAAKVKKRTAEELMVLNREPGEFTAVAFATAEEYRLELLAEALSKKELYEIRIIDNQPDVVHAITKYPTEYEPRELFFFREGSVVFWNVPTMETNNLLRFVQQFEQDSYNFDIVQSESEALPYFFTPEGKNSHLHPSGKIFLSSKGKAEYEKYAFSNAMALSVKLGAWESSLNKYIDTIEFVTEDLKQGNKIKMTREEVLRKHGELFALRHLINLSSDLLDTPDFYWDRENLEMIYLQTCAYYSINRRTKVMNEKLNHCVELIELLSSHLSDKHHIRLEWMIIVLIMVEVAFETIHYIDRYLADK